MGVKTSPWGRIKVPALASSSVEVSENVICNGYRVEIFLIVYALLFSFYTVLFGELI